MSPVDRITHFIDNPQAEDFGSLALAAFAYQYERIAPYRDLCKAKNAHPDTVLHWREIPLVSTLPAPGAEEPVRRVRSHPHLDLYRKTIDASFPEACLVGMIEMTGTTEMGRPPALSLIPSAVQRPDSSLSFMVDHILAHHVDPDSLTAFGPSSVQAQVARSWLAARQRDGRAALILATVFALLQLLDSLENLDLRFRLPAGSRVLETGGFKGRTREVTRSELLERLKERLGVPPTHVVREYGMTELTSQCYTRVLSGGDPDLFVPPHWMRVRIVDPASFEEVDAGTPGLIALLDLANLGIAVHLLTEDLGCAEADGFRIPDPVGGVRNCR